MCGSSGQGAAHSSALLQVTGAVQDAAGNVAGAVKDTVSTSHLSV